MKKSQHITKSEGGWAVKGAGNKKATKILPTQKKAIEYGRQIAINQQTELVIHGRNGKIREKDSFGNDTHPPKG